MKVNFIGQGLNNKSYENTAGGYILHSLKKSKFHTLNAFVAFVRLSGLNDIIDELVKLNERGLVQLFIGIDLNGTSQEALELLLKHGIKTRIVYSPNNITYHPKIYLFSGEDKSRLILGSSNLTMGGLFNNVEASVCIDLKNKRKKDSVFINEIHDYYAPIMNQSHESSQALTKELLKTLIESKIVIPEKQISRSIALEKTAQSDKNDEINNLFKNLKNTKLKKSVKKSSPTHIVTSTSYNAMWVETRKLTGGSGNILDIAMTGNKNGSQLKGPSTFFNISIKTKETDIKIHFKGNIYEGNTLKYTPDNGSWRLQLKGRTINGKKFTDNTRLGALKDKILLFSKIKKDEYTLKVLSVSALSSLQSKSIIWGYNGKLTTSKIYGFIK